MSEPHARCLDCGELLVECVYGGDHPRDAVSVASTQIAEALVDLDRHPDSYVRWPWQALDELYGGMAPGTVHYVVGFSGLGKSTFISSAILRWAERGMKVDVLPLEIRPNTFRTYLACQQLDIDPGLMLSGDFWRLPNAEALRAAVVEQVRSQMHAPFVHRVYVHGVREVNVMALQRAAAFAAERGAQVLVIDHIDHLEGDQDRQRTLYEQSVAVNRAALRVAQEADLVLIAMSQANQAALHGTADKLAKYQPPQDHHVLNGGHKRHNATGMLGLFRPLIEPPEGGSREDYEAWKETIKRARAGLEPPHTALEPNTAGVVLMKSRTYGGREGRRIKLAWRNGRLVDRVALPHSLRRVS